MMNNKDTKNVMNCVMTSPIMTFLRETMPTKASIAEINPNKQAIIGYDLWACPVSKRSQPL